MDVRCYPSENAREGMIILQGIYTGNFMGSLTLTGQISDTNINRNIKALWDFNIKCDHDIEARRPEISVVNEAAEECKIIDEAVP